MTYQTKPKSKKPTQKKVALGILHDMLLMFDSFHHMNQLLNVGNKGNTDYWSVEAHYNAINTFFLHERVNNDQKGELFDLIYNLATKRLGDKNFKSRAKQIHSAVSKAKNVVSV